MTSFFIVTLDPGSNHTNQQKDLLNQDFLFLPIDLSISLALQHGIARYVNEAGYFVKTTTGIFGTPAIQILTARNI